MVFVNNYLFLLLSGVKACDSCKEEPYAANTGT